MQIAALMRTVLMHADAEHSVVDREPMEAIGGLAETIDIDCHAVDVGTLQSPACSCC